MQSHFASAALYWIRWRGGGSIFVIRLRGQCAARGLETSHLSGVSFSAAMRTQVGIIGAGPAGLFLSLLLQRAGIESAVVELHTRDYVEERVRAGLLEHGTVELMHELGVGERLKQQGLQHGGIELRFGGRGHRIDFRELAGGKYVTIYAQHEVMKDLIAARVAANKTIVFEAKDVRVRNLQGPSPAIHFEANGISEKLDCDFIAGCDGFHGICRPAIPPEALTIYDREYPFGWLGILAQAPPSSHELIYAYHERGFALLSMRSAEISRLYLQCATDEDIAQWPDASDLGRVAQALSNERRMEIDGRAGDSKRRDQHAQLRHRADAVWQIVFGGRRRAYRAAHRCQRVKSRGSGCACAGTGVRRILRRRENGVAFPVFGNLFAAGMESTTIFLVDDCPAASLRGR